MMMRIGLHLLLISMLVGCAGTRGGIRTCDSWDELFNSPKAHDGREVALYGWFSAQFEACVLGSPDGKHEVWIVPSDAEPTLCTLKQAVSEPVNQWAEVTGVFNYGASYGHLGSYKAALAKAKTSAVSSKPGKICVVR